MKPLKIYKNELEKEKFYCSVQNSVSFFPKMFRPDFDTYYMRLAHDVAIRSNCMKECVGAIIVSKKKRLISTGYSGTPVSDKNCNKGGCLKCNSEINIPGETCKCLHAEENAILEVDSVKAESGYIYITSFPCNSCAVKIFQIGITTICYDTTEIDLKVKDWLKKHKGITLKYIKP